MTQQFKIRLPDGSVREVEQGTTPADIAAAIGPGLAKAALAARINGEVRDLRRPFEEDAELALITARDEADALELARHDFAHVLAEAVQNLFPGTQITFGPATEDGFYYDFAPKDRPFTDEDLPAIEEEMRRVIARDEPLIREVWKRDDVRHFFEKQGETFKAEWVMELPGDETITMYVRAAGWTCAGASPRLDRASSTAGVQADARVRRLLARRPEERDAEPHLRDGAGSTGSSSTRICCVSRKRRSATIAGSARRWTCSTSSRRRRARSSGIRRDGRCGASSKPICAAGSTPRGIRKSRHRS
jgi:hypothetical protein